MFKAIIVDKRVLEDKRLEIDIDFTDGIESNIETCIPQDEKGLAHFIESRINELNSGKKMREDLPVGEFKKEEKVISEDEKNAKEWMRKVNKYYSIKTILIDTGILTGNEKEITNLVDEIKSGYSKEYLKNI